MRQARSYSIVDHILLHGGYLARLSHAALALYLFLVVVGDRDGRSFYSEASIGAILRLCGPALADARRELITAGLVRYRRPYWWVESLTRAQPPTSHPHSRAPAPIRPPCPSPMPVRGFIPEALRDLIRSLEEKP